MIFLELSVICQAVDCSEVAEPECNVLNETSNADRFLFPSVQTEASILLISPALATYWAKHLSLFLLA